MSRLGYAVGQIFKTHSDSGGTQFNFSEIVGNSTAVAISTAYYPDTRDEKVATRSFADLDEAKSWLSEAAQGWAAD